MAQVIVRNLDERMVEAHKLKARLQGKSLEQHLRDLLVSTARLTPEEKVALSDAVVRMTPEDAPEIDSAVLIREDRDSR